jgi:aspartate/methionine/tyrosine aminotransferase
MKLQRVMQSEYMHWAKTSSGAKYNLALSDLEHFPISDLSIRISDLQITGSSGYGYQPLLEAIARKENVTSDCVVETLGTSMANYIAMAALIDPGDEVVIEHPTYELILSTAQYLGANVKRFHRRFEQKFSVDIDELRQVVTSKTKLIIITNLHNPSSAYTSEEVLKQVGETAANVGAKVLVDEVYLDAAFSKKPCSAFHLGNHFVTTNSLTKVYGLSGLRCGWILAEPTIAQKMWRLIDLHYSTHVHIAEQLSVTAFSQLDKISERARLLLKQNCEMIQAFFSSRNDITAIPHEQGLITFPKLHSRNAEQLCALLRDKYETTVVPGKFFDMPDHIRIGVGSESAMLKQGLARIALALDAMAKAT